MTHHTTIGNYIFDSLTEPGYISTCQVGHGHENKEIEMPFQVEFCEEADYWMVLDGDIVIDDCLPSREAAEDRAKALAERRQEREAV